jgi:type I restriction enzyme S subunit
MLLRATNIQDGKLDDLDPVYIPRDLVKNHQFLIPGDIIMASSSGSIQIVGKNALVRENLDATFGAFCTVIRAREVNPTFLFYFLQSPVLRQQWSDLARGSNINNLKTTDTSSTIVPVPPTEEQKQIVETLDSQLSKVDSIVQTLNDAHLKGSTLQRSVLEHFLSPSQSSSLTTLGEHLETRKIKGIPSQEPNAEYLGLEHVEAHSGQISGYGSASDFKSSSPIVEPGDVLYGRLRPYLNKVVIAPKRLYASGEFIVFKPSETVLGPFLKFLLMSPSFLAFTASLDTGDRPRVSWDKISNFEFYLPSLENQVNIVESIGEALSRHSVFKSGVGETKRKTDDLRRSILHAAFTGQ